MNQQLVKEQLDYYQKTGTWRTRRVSSLEIPIIHTKADGFIERRVGALKGLCHIMTIDGRWYLTDIVTGYRMDSDCLKGHRPLLEELVVTYLDDMIDNLVGFKGNPDGSVTVWTTPREGTNPDQEPSASQSIVHVRFPKKGDA